jgi:hypothetical protein
MRHSSTLTSCLRSPVRQAIQSPNPKKTVWFGVSSILELGTRSLLGICYLGFGACRGAAKTA